MSENSTKNTNRAAIGKTRLTKAAVEKPDTLVFLPDGRQITLRREDQESMPLFRKFNPRKVNPTAKKHHHKQDGGDSSGKGVFRRGQRIPITKVLLGAFLLYNVLGTVKGWWQRWRRHRQLQQRQQQQQEEEDFDEEEQELAPEVAAAEGKLQQALLPAMMRAALPKPQRSNAARQQAQAHKARQRHVPTASKMMQPGPDIKRRQPGMLGKLDQAMRKQVRDLVLAQEQAHQLQLEAAKRVLALQAGTAANHGAAAAAPAADGKPHAAAGAAGRGPPLVQPAATPVRRR